jgi:hypothetical protein
MWKLPQRTEEHYEAIDRMNRKRGHPHAVPCCICGLLMIPTDRTPMVHLGEGGSHLVTEKEAAQNPAGDMYWYPVGPECWRKYKKEILEYSDQEKKA